MDSYDFDRLPVKGDLVITKGRLTGYVVNAFNEDSISFESVLENGLPEVHPLGDEGLDEKLILHIPLAEAIAGIKKAQGTLSECKEGSQLEVWIAVSIHSERLEWTTHGMDEYIPAVVKWEVRSQRVFSGWAHGFTLRASTTSEEIWKLAEELISVIEENFERI